MPATVSLQLTLETPEGPAAGVTSKVTGWLTDQPPGFVSFSAVILTVGGTLSTLMLADP